jgi:hypothetical protein
MRALSLQEMELVAGGYESGDVDPTYLKSLTCPTNTTCKPYTGPDGSTGKFVEAPDGNLYLSDSYGAQIDKGEIDWGGVARDLAIIGGGALGGLAAGPAGIVSGFIAIGVWAGDLVSGNGEQYGDQ